MRTPTDIRLLIRKLLTHDSTIADDAELAHLVRHIAELEVAEGGPYVLPNGSCDFGLNIAIAVFLQRQGALLPKLHAFVLQRMAEQATASGLISSTEVAALIAEYTNVAVPAPETAVPREETACIDALWAFASTQYASLPLAFQTCIRQVLERTIRRNPDKQMYLMPLYVQQALGEQGTVCISTQLGELGFVSACFWASFIVYDDFWDQDEAAAPKELPVANWLAQQFIQYFLERHEGTVFGAFFKSSMGRLHAANSWELLHCRAAIADSVLQIPETLPAYGAYDIKYRPAAGHLMAPLSLLVAAGYSPDSKEFVAYVSYCKHYLIAMQLNDDLHDWKEDLRRGHTSTAVAALLTAVQKKHPHMTQVHLQQDEPLLEELLWDEAVPLLCNWILSHTRLSRLALARMRLPNPKPLEKFIEKNEAAAYAALHTKERGAVFIQAITNPAIL